MMKCAQVAEKLDEWEKEGRLDAAVHRELEEHFGACPDCAARYGALRGLVRRDALEEAVPAVGGPAPDLADAVMARLDRRDPARSVRRSHFSAARRRHLVVPGAAAALLVVALSFMYLRRPDSEGDLVTLRLVLDAPTARTVAVTGNFGQWSAKGIPLKRSADGVSWETTLRLRRSFEYQYN